MAGRSEILNLVPSVQLTALLSPHFIKSGPVCDHRDNCECPLEYYCPLCSQEFIADNVSVMETHYNEVHWNGKISLGHKFTVFPCGLIHASARVSLSGLVAFANPLHFHCPYCPGMCTHFKTSETLMQHVHVAHGNKFHAEGSSIVAAEWSFADHCRELADADEIPTRRVGFKNTINIREFPLCASIVEQSGGRSETKKTKMSFDSYVDTNLVDTFAACDIAFSGCDYKSMKLFKSCTLLICGTEFPNSVLSGITSLGGTVSGANYLESGEWDRITHILLGTRISLKSVRALRRNIPAHVWDNLVWVGIDWVKKSIECGKIFGTRKIFNPAAIERFFTIREANSRAEKRKSLRIKPDIFTKSMPQIPDVQPVHVVASPRLSPTVSFSSDDQPLIGPSMTPPSMTPESTAIIPIDVPMDVVQSEFPPTASTADHGLVLSSINHPCPDHGSLRRSKRLSIMTGSHSAKSFSMMYPIKKKHI
jgi:hypothetical protein